MKSIVKSNYKYMCNTKKTFYVRKYILKIRLKTRLYSFFF